MAKIISNPQLIVSASISGTNNTYLPLPGPGQLSGAAYTRYGTNYFSVEDVDKYSYQVYVTGSATGTLALQISNNFTGWVTYLTQPVSQSNGADYFLFATTNGSNFARVAWSGSAGTVTPSASISVSYYGRSNQ